MTYTKKILYNLFLLLLLLVLTQIFIFPGCRQANKNTPEDFEVSMNYDVGALPPQYHYYYKIKIGPDGQCLFEYQPGYGEPPAPQAWQSSFNLSQDQLDNLYGLLVDNNFFRKIWEEGEVSCGSDSTSIEIKAGSKIFKIPSDSSLRSGDASKVREVAKFIKELVPQKIWSEMQAMQQDFENSYDDLTQ
jgi:hypothetical protein